jgi:F-type H+-transporting ATPase subunit epsilon
MNDKEIRVRIITPFGVYKETTASIINFKNTEGHRGLLANHIPLVSIIPISQMIIVENGIREKYAVGDGMLYFKDNFCRILVDVIENEKDINYNRAYAAKERALKRIEDEEGNTDFDRAEVSLKKAINRINTIGK